MDRKHSKQAEVERLMRLGADSRRILGREAATLKRRLDVPTRVRDSLSANPLAWLFGSLASGMAASVFFRRRPAGKIRPKGRGIPGVLLGLILTAVQPVAKIWLARQLSRWTSGATVAPPPQRLEPRPLPRPHSP